LLSIHQINARFYLIFQVFVPIFDVGSLSNLLVDSMQTFSTVAPDKPVLAGFRVRIKGGELHPNQHGYGERYAT